MIIQFYRNDFILYCIMRILCRQTVACKNVDQFCYESENSRVQASTFSMFLAMWDAYFLSCIKSGEDPVPINKTKSNGGDGNFFFMKNIIYNINQYIVMCIVVVFLWEIDILCLCNFNEPDNIKVIIFNILSEYYLILLDGFNNPNKLYPYYFVYLSVFTHIIIRLLFQEFPIL